MVCGVWGGRVWGDEKWVVNSVRGEEDVFGGGLFFYDVLKEGEGKWVLRFRKGGLGFLG